PAFAPEPAAPEPAPAPRPEPPRRRDEPRRKAEPPAPEPQSGSRLLLASIPVAVVLIGLCVPLVRDILAYAGGRVTGPDFSGAEKEVDLDALPLAVDLRFHDETIDHVLHLSRPDRQVTVHWKPSMRFGLSRKGEGAADRNRLTYDTRGLTNNTVVKLDGAEHVFGEQGWVSAARGVFSAPVSPGRWKTLREKAEPRTDLKMREGQQSTWSFDAQKVEVTQTVGLVAGAQSSQVDTCLVLYRMTNRDARPHSVGVRALLDTFIGNNDGVPFLVPGQDRLISSMLEFRREDVPDFIQACEHEVFDNPGTVCRIGFRVAGLESPKRVLLGAWPDSQHGRPAEAWFTRWEVPLLPIKKLDPADSAVTVYWDARELGPGESREVGFTYGLGKVAGGGQLALSVGGSFAPGGEFTLTAYVRDPERGARLKLTLPEGFTLAGGDAEATVPPLPADGSTRISPVTWRVRGGPREGRYDLKVK
ncbi:MAG: hypothetical protein ACRC33_00845, partial [Gemmataceae bacterium]